MPDMICPLCGEPWDTSHIRSDMEPLMYPENAPPEIADLSRTLAAAEDGYMDTRGLPDSNPLVKKRHSDMETARDALGLAAYNTGLSKGCPACWDEPSRIPDDPDARQENLRAALFDGVWDGDPAEFFG